MNNTINKLLEAQKHAMSIRPKIGGFPTLAEVLRRAGVQRNQWSLPACQAIYIMNDGAVVQQGTPLITGICSIPKFNQPALITALRTDQAGQSTFPEFLHSIWNAGITEYAVDFTLRKVTYYGINGESYLEEYPAVEIS